VAASLKSSTALRRYGFRVAHALLRVYWFLRRPSSHGVKCLLTDGDRVLLVRHTYGRPAWEIPGGAIKLGEEPMSAARREMLEELGLTIENWISLGEVTGRIDFRRDTLHCFHSEQRDPKLDPDYGELAAASWFPRSQLPSDLGGYVLPVLARLPSGRS
jgi:8-oxo-dGTP pyrophosphatase MutT (NUDIX family)